MLSDRSVVFVERSGLPVFAHQGRRQPSCSPLNDRGGVLPATGDPASPYSRTTADLSSHAVQQLDEAAAQQTFLAAQVLLFYDGEGRMRRLDRKPIV